MANNPYEDARQQRLQDNMKRFEALGIREISKNLSQIVKPEIKSPCRHLKPKSRENVEMLKIRRSSRAARNPVPLYSEIDAEFPLMRRRYGRKSLVSFKFADYKEREYAIESAEKFRSNLKSGHQSFVKPMVRSHVSSCFWLGLPTKFCKENLPEHDLKMVLEDEDGIEYDSVYIGRRTGLSGGWKGFAMDHNLDDGDALIFELREPTRFKVYIFKASDYSNQASGEKLADSKNRKSGSSKALKRIENDDESAAAQKLRQEIESSKRAERVAKRTRQKE